MNNAIKERILLHSSESYSALNGGEGCSVSLYADVDSYRPTNYVVVYDSCEGFFETDYPAYYLAVKQYRELHRKVMSLIYNYRRS